MEKPNMAPVTMETPWRVRFRNVGQAYFPQTRVECCYTISSKHTWNNRDWIGLFKVGWGSVKDYYTFAWALTPDGYTAGTDVNCSVVFQPSYLPSPGGTAFQFVYVDGMDQICGVSPHFTFSAPRPLDELVTLEEETNGEDDNGADLLLVVPKAQILQSHLEACQEELKQAQKKFEAAAENVEEQRKRHESERNSFEEERTKMRDEIEDLRRSLRSSMEKVERMEEKQKDVLMSHEKISAEMKGLFAERTEHHQRIKELEDDLSNLTLQKQEAEVELDRMKERVKKLTTQRKDEEDEKRNLQMESKQAQEELRVLQERVEASERSTEALRRDLSELGALQGHSHAELHQVRLQAAQMTLQLSQAHLALREGQASWAQERESMRQASEVEKDRIQKLSRELQKKEEWLQEERAERERLEAELGSQKDCNRELRASLRAIQKEREQHQLERQELLDHIRVLQLRIERDAGALWSEAASSPLNIDSVPSVTERSSLEKANESLLPQRKEEEEEEANQGEAALASLPEPTGNHKKETDREEMEAVDLSGESALDTGIEKQLHLSEVERNKSRTMMAWPHTSFKLHSPAITNY